MSSYWNLEVSNHLIRGNSLFSTNTQSGHWFEVFKHHASSKLKNKALVEIIYFGDRGHSRGLVEGQSNYSFHFELLISSYN